MRVQVLQGVLFSRLVQLEERLVLTQKVKGSSPLAAVYVQIGASPNGKARGFGSRMYRFESDRPCLYGPVV